MLLSNEHVGVVEWSGAFAVVGWGSAGDGGMPTIFNVSTFDSSKDYSRQDVATIVADFVSSGDTGRLVYSDQDGAAFTVRGGGSTPTKVDDGVVDVFFLSHDTVVYLTDFGALRRTSLDSINPTTLIEANFDYDLAFASPDEQSLLVWTYPDASNTSQMGVVSLTKPGPQTVLPTSASMMERVFFPLFTADSKY